MIELLEFCAGWAATVSMIASGPISFLAWREMVAIRESLEDDGITYDIPPLDLKPFVCGNDRSEG